ncbi:MAG: hypothetical protein J7L23_05060 [Candidatus Diapherotrites archaeon]|nr:hypothetical protein [Candidatus Diapherotrites archaeon]
MKERYRKKLDALWNKAPELRKNFSAAKPLLERHIDEFNRHTKSKMDLERLKLPSESIAARVINKIARNNSEFDPVEFLQAFKAAKEYANHLAKIEKATKKINELEDKAQA